jgi:hypothetical protein
MKNCPFAALIVLVFATCSPAFAQLTRDAAITKTEAILENLQTGHTAEIVKEFDGKMAQALPASKLEEVWSSVIGQFGAFKGIDERREGRFQNRQTVELFLAFDKETIVMRTVYDGDGKVGGLVFRPKDRAVLPANK